MRYRGRFYQLAGREAAAQAKVVVCEGRFGRITIEYRGRELRFTQIEAPTRPGIEPVKRRQEQQRAMRAGVRRAAAANHPWKQAAREGATRKALRAAGLLPTATLTRPSAPPFGLRRAALRAGSTKHNP